MNKPTVHIAREQKTPEEARAIKEFLLEHCGPTDGVYARCPVCKAYRGWLKSADGTIRCNQCGTTDPEINAAMDVVKTEAGV